MPEPSNFNHDVNINGHLWARSWTPPAASVVADSVHATANIPETKLQHRHLICQAQDKGSAVAAKRTLVHIVRNSTATLKGVAAALSQACVGDSTISIAIKKNGTNILGSPIGFSSSDVAFAVKTGTIASPDLVQGDCLEVDVTVTAGTGTLGQGLSVQLEVVENSP